ncbi:MAG: ABC transporter permease [Candidatus Omnitrophica bacterium]|nr:ABC transporter permease [Candidatus Omnitrophota bacterium]
MSIRKILSFIRKDAIINMSYRTIFLMSFVRIISSTLIFFFMAKLFRKPEYFPFVLIGIAFTSYLYTSLGTFSSRFRDEQAAGTLEAMLVAPTKTKDIFIGIGAWDYLFTTFRVFIYILLGVLFFGVNLNNANILAAILILCLSIICFSCMGISAAGLVLIFKRMNPVTWIIGGFTGLVGGVYFPVEILPIWIRGISYILPLTYSLKGLRGALLYGNSIRELMPEILLLCIFIIVLFPLSTLIFKKAMKKTKIDGSLVHY